MSDWKESVPGYPFSLRLPRRMAINRGPWDGSQKPIMGLAPEQHEWCRTNTKGGFKISGGTRKATLTEGQNLIAGLKEINISYRQINFECEEDAALFKLFWL